MGNAPSADSASAMAFITAGHQPMAPASPALFEISPADCAGSARCVPVTLSLGAAVSRAGAETDANALVQAADQALYEAKHAGRNRVHVVEGPAPA